VPVVPHQSSRLSTTTPKVLNGKVLAHTSFHCHRLLDQINQLRSLPSLSQRQADNWGRTREATSNARRKWRSTKLVHLREDFKAPCSSHKGDLRTSPTKLGEYASTEYNSVSRASRRLLTSLGLLSTLREKVPSLKSTVNLESAFSYGRRSIS